MVVQPVVHVPRAALCADLAPARPLRIGATAAASHTRTNASHEEMVLEEKEDEWLKPSPQDPVEGPKNQVHVTEGPYD